MAKAKVSGFAVTKEAGVDHGVILTWKWGKGQYTDHFSVDYEYWAGSYKKKENTSEPVWVSAGMTEYTVANSKISGKTYRVSWNAPNNALRIRARVKPFKKDNLEKKNQFSGDFTSWKYADFRTDALPAPSLSVSFDESTSKAVVTVSSSDQDAKTCQVEVKYGSTVKYNNNNVNLVDGGYTKTYTVAAGQTWTIHARVRSHDDKATSPWSSTQTVTAKPGVPTIVKGSNKAFQTDGIQMSWNSVTGATSYTVEYVADNPSYFKTNPSAVTSVTSITDTSFKKTGLDAGHIWYMRVQAVNATGASDFTDGKASAKIALVPDAPTTYDTDPSYTVGDTARLRWTHNCEDNADQKAAQVEVKLSSSQSGTTYSVNSGNMFYNLSLASFADGSIVQWRVRTKGNLSEWSPWSAWKQFSVYSMPTVTCSLSQTSGTVDSEEHPLTSLPLIVELEASGGGSSVVGYHLTVTASEDVERTERDGTVSNIAAGSVLYETDYTIDETPYEVELGVEAGLPDASLLAITADVVMASGLRDDTEEIPFLVDFDSEVPQPDCSVVFDRDSLSAEIWCACYDVDENENETLADDVVLSVYRIESDNTLTLIEDNLPNTGDVSVADPHASFGICSYRVVAMSTQTGEISFTDGDAESKYGTCVIQWDESKGDYVESGDDESGALFAYSGNRLDGLYNLNFDESGGVQSEDVEYIGRKHPVSYYGTQLGHTANYQVDFPKQDAETLSKCRSIMAWVGDVYVREPSGTGFWARVSNPRISRKYDNGAVSFSFEAIHVEHSKKAM